MRVSEQEEVLHWKAKKIQMTDERYNLTDEYYDFLSDVCEVINRAAKGRIDLNKYEIDTKFDANVYNEGLPVEFVAQRVDVYVVDKATKEEEWAGSIEIADDCWTSVSDEEKRNGYVLAYSSRSIREDADEIFRDWAKEAEEDE